METKPKLKRGRWIAFGLVVGLAASWGGFTVAESAPSSIQTCTRKTGTMKVTTVPCKGKTTHDVWDHRNVTNGLRNQVTLLTSQINRGCVDLAVVGANGQTVFPNWPDAVAAHTTHQAGFLYRHPECTGHLTLR
jgi:hypothetical protein